MKRRLLAVFLLLIVYALFKTGHLTYTGPSCRLASYPVPTNGPVAEVHPEVLNLQSSFSHVAELVKPAVVSISTIHVEQIQSGAPEFFFGDPLQEFFDQYLGPQGMPSPPRRRMRRGHPREFKTEGVGSGVLIDADGLILTNEHVVRDADQIKVMVYEKSDEKKEYTGKVIGKDARTDLAVIRIKVGHKLPFAKLGDSEKVKVGDWAIAIGSPFGLAQTVTVGVISAERQSLPIEGREYRNLIQTDAAINRGNSGGPLLNVRGEVVGINTAIYAPTGVFAGIGFAVPVNQAKGILNDLIVKGHVVRGWLGVELGREISPAMVKAFGLSDAKGALVNHVLKDSPADKAGLKRGDVIRRFDGNDVENAEQLQNTVSRTPPKKSVEVEVIRGKTKKSLTLILGERPESVDTGEGEKARPESKTDKEDQREWKGAHVVTATPDLAGQFHQPKDEAGVIVTDVESSSVADDLGLMVGDLILGVNQTPIPDAASFSKVISKVDLKEGVVFDVVRQGHPMYLSYTSTK